MTIYFLPSPYIDSNGIKAEIFRFFIFFFTLINPVFDRYTECKIISLIAVYMYNSAFLAMGY